MNNFYSNSNQETKKEEAAQKATSSWMDNPKLAGMDMSKLAMLNALAEQGSAKKTPQELLPFLMSAASTNKSKGVRFSPQEMEAIIQVLKAGKSPEEAARMEKILQMFKMLG